MTKSGEWGQGDKETRRQGDKEKEISYPLVSPSPCPLVPIPVRPDAILFNGGFFAPAVTRDRVVETVANWFRKKEKQWQPKVLNNEAPEAVAAEGFEQRGAGERGRGGRLVLRAS